MKKTLMALAILAFFVAMLPFSLALENSTMWCIDSTHLAENYSWTLDGVAHTYIGQPQLCRYGCDSQSSACSPSPWDKNMGIVGNVNLGLLPAFAIILIIVLAVIGLLRKH